MTVRRRHIEVGRPRAEGHGRIPTGTRYNNCGILGASSEGTDKQLDKVPSRTLTVINMSVSSRMGNLMAKVLTHFLTKENILAISRIMLGQVMANMKVRAGLITLVQCSRKNLQSFGMHVN